MARDPTELLSRAPVIPVLTIERVTDAVPLARALVAGGLSVLEITLRTTIALDAATRIAARVPDAIVGLGTVTQVPDIRTALASGARFLVSPGTPPELAEALARAPVPVLPGCATVSEAMALAALGAGVEILSRRTVRRHRLPQGDRSPLPHIRFCPTGGIDPRNAAAYLALPNVIAVGGSWVAPQDAIAAGDFARVTALAQEATARIPTTRTGRSPVIVMNGRPAASAARLRSRTPPPADQPSGGRRIPRP